MGPNADPPPASLASKHLPGDRRRPPKGPRFFAERRFVKIIALRPQVARVACAAGRKIHSRFKRRAI
jgi:hypothetical protein